MPEQPAWGGSGDRTYSRDNVHLKGGVAWGLADPKVKRRKEGSLPRTSAMCQSGLCSSTKTQLQWRHHQDYCIIKLWSPQQCLTISLRWKSQVWPWPPALLFIFRAELTLSKVGLQVKLLSGPFLLWRLQPQLLPLPTFPPRPKSLLTLFSAWVKHISLTTLSLILYLILYLCNEDADGMDHKKMPAKCSAEHRLETGETLKGFIPPKLWSCPWGDGDANVQRCSAHDPPLPSWHFLDATVDTPILGKETHPGSYCRWAAQLGLKPLAPGPVSRGQGGLSWMRLNGFWGCFLGCTNGLTVSRPLNSAHFLLSSLLEL